MFRKEYALSTYTQNAAPKTCEVSRYICSLHSRDSTARDGIHCWEISIGGRVDRKICKADIWISADASHN